MADCKLCVYFNTSTCSDCSENYENKFERVSNEEGVKELKRQVAVMDKLFIEGSIDDKTHTTLVDVLNKEISFINMLEALTGDMNFIDEEDV